MTDYENVFEMIDKYSFDVDSPSTDQVLCVVCAHLLHGVCRADCGCAYCRKCMEKCPSYTETCPGNGVAFQLAKIDAINNILKDDRANGKLSNLQGNCPFILCKYHGTLIEMSNHLKTLDELPVCGHIGQMGCPTKAMEIETEMNTHENLLAKFVMDNKKDKCQEDKPATKEYDTVFLRISDILSKKQVLIDGIFKELKDLKTKMVKNAKITEETKNLNKRNVNEISISRENNERQIYQLEQALQSQIKQLQQELYYQKQVLNRRQFEFSELRQQTNRIEELVRKTKDVSKYKVEKITKVAAFKWNIENLIEIREEGEEMIYSKYYYSVNKEYKMRLWLYPNGNDDDPGSNVSLQLLVWNNDPTCSVAFPFKADVTITLRNDIIPQFQQSITQFCFFDVPSIFIYSTSDIFNFNYAILNKSGVFDDEYASVECTVFIYK